MIGVVVGFGKKTTKMTIYEGKKGYFWRINYRLDFFMNCFLKMIFLF